MGASVPDGSRSRKGGEYIVTGRRAKRRGVARPKLSTVLPIPIEHVSAALGHATHP